MGNGIAKLKLCFAGDVGEIWKRRHDIGLDVSDSLDKGLGHSFYYILHDSSSKTQLFPDDSSSSTSTTISNSSNGGHTMVFRTISGASISANTDIDRPSVFESSQWFSSFPLQPIRSGPIPCVSVTIERRFFSGPVERTLTSGPLENQLQRSSKWDLVRNLKKFFSRNLEEKKKESNSWSTEASLVDDDEDTDSLTIQNVQWAQGKAGEDRVHVVISEEHGWVFVGIYDGFYGPDAADFLLNHLYSNVFKELKGFDQSKLNDDGVEGNTNKIDVLKALSEALRVTEALYLELTDTMLMENPELALIGSCLLVMLMKGKDVYLMNVGDSRAVLAQNPEGLHTITALYRVDSDRKNNLTCHQLTKDHSTSVKEEVVRIRNEHPNDASAIKNGRVKGSLNVTRAFGAGFLKQPKWNNALVEMFRIDYIGKLPYINCLPSLHHHRLSPSDRFLMLSSDGIYQYLSNEEAVSEVETFMCIFPEGDPSQHLVEQVLFRAAKKAGMKFHELLDIPQGDRRKYHDDVSIVVISFEGRIWRSSV